MRESVIEKYLHDKVTAAGGTTRKFSSAHRPNNPDRIVIWPEGFIGFVQYIATIDFVECKAPGEKPRPGQVREHKRLRDMGCTVLVLDTKEKIDAYVKANKRA